MQEHPRLNFTITIVIIGLSITFGILAVVSFLGEFNEPYTFTYPEVSNDRFLITTYQEEEVRISMNTQMNLTTTGLSAQNPIKVDVRTYPSTKYTETIPNQWQTLPTKLRVVLPTATLYQNDETTINTAEFEMIRNDDLKEYYGSGEIIYASEGEKGIAIFPPSILEGRTAGKNVFYGNDLLDDAIRHHPTFYVSSWEATNSLRTNDIFLGLTFLFVIFSLVETRSKIILGFSWLLDYGKNDPRNTKNQ